MRIQIFSVRCNIYISRLCYDVSVRLSVRLSVTEVHWGIIVNLGFKFRSKFIAHCGRMRCMPGRGEGSSRAMLATARPSCCLIQSSTSSTIGRGCSIYHACSGYSGKRNALVWCLALCPSVCLSVNLSVPQ